MRSSRLSSFLVDIVRSIATLKPFCIILDDCQWCASLAILPLLPHPLRNVFKGFFFFKEKCLSTLLFCLLKFVFRLDSASVGLLSDLLRRQPPIMLVMALRSTPAPGSDLDLILKNPLTQVTSQDFAGSCFPTLLTPLQRVKLEPLPADDIVSLLKHVLQVRDPLNTLLLFLFFSYL